MMLKLYEVLSKAEVAAFRQALGPDAGWIDGATTAGHQAREVKKNRQLPEASALNQRLGQAVLQALARHPQFFAAALPLRIYPPQFNCYAGGETYGDHIDNALRLIPGSGERMRSDLSATLFLTEPEEYDGGELVLQDSYGEHRVKMAAGDMVLYPSASRHRVTPVTAGERVGCFLWLQSMVRSDVDRDMLQGLDHTIRRLTVERGVKNMDVAHLTGLYHNLLRRFAET